MATVDESIRNADSAICRHIHNIGTFSRGQVSQDMLAQLRNLVEAVMLKLNVSASDENINYVDIKSSVRAALSHGELQCITKLHKFLQSVSSHYTFDEEDSERLMLKYYRYLVEMKVLVKQRLGMEILHNLAEFPMNTDKSMQEYYEKIAQKINNPNIQGKMHSEKYYIYKIKPFFTKEQVYYEVTFTRVTDTVDKSNRNIAFTKIMLPENYAITLEYTRDSIQILDRIMMITIITGYNVAIRSCEYKNFVSIVTGKVEDVTYREQNAINEYLTHTCCCLCDVVLLSDNTYNKVIQSWFDSAKSSVFVRALTHCRKIIKEKRSGHNVLRYLLYGMNNTIIKLQRDNTRNCKGGAD